ncbi:hypothetical protein V6N12_059248 [Hibiscus sabdariffa]|uniref:Uncharacterized protein n=1 Tax=Hibiscus sabdariffa TaxID=183260 RepID=A0ABR2EUK7_9ROSI
MPNEWHTPLEVPGNRLPETGSRRKLLNVRGAWQEVWMQELEGQLKRPRQNRANIEFKGSRTLRKEVVLKQLRVKRPRNEQKRYLPRSGHLPRFSVEAEKETQQGSRLDQNNLLNIPA